MNYLLSDNQSDNYNADKAKNDILHFLNEFEHITVDCSSYFSKYQSVKKTITQMNSNDTFVLQYPSKLGNFFEKKILEKCKKKNISTILIIHDINVLRFDIKKLFRFKNLNDEISVLNLAAVIIVPNLSMKNILVNNGLKVKTEILDIYDYRVSNAKNKKILNLKQIIFAGNLNKSNFIEHLNPNNYHVKLYGMWDSKDKINMKNISYEGSLPSDDLVNEINGGYGLVWDGMSPDKISGKLGEYMKYNNPHKLSLYLASGIPVIVWKESAISKYVEKYKIGYSVSSLNEIEEILSKVETQTYQMMVDNVFNIRQKLLVGEHTKNAIKLAKKDLEKK